MIRERQIPLRGGMRFDSLFISASLVLLENVWFCGIIGMFISDEEKEKTRNLKISDDSLKPYLQQIDEMDESTRRLEEAAVLLDQYVTQLGGCIENY